MLNNWLSNSWLSEKLRSLDWLIINILFNSLLRDIIDLNFLSNVRDVFSDMFNLLIISVNFFNWDVACLSNILIFSHRSSNWNIFNSLLWDLFDVLSFIRNLNIIDLLFIISISFLDWNVFDVRLILRLWLLINSCWYLIHNLCWDCTKNLLRLNNRLDQRLVYKLCSVLYIWNSWVICWLDKGLWSIYWWVIDCWVDHCWVVDLWLIYWRCW